jgi:hypothetical protein
MARLIARAETARRAKQLPAVANIAAELARASGATVATTAAAAAS